MIFGENFIKIPPIYHEKKFFKVAHFVKSAFFGARARTFLPLVTRVDNLRVSKFLCWCTIASKKIRNHHLKIFSKFVSVRIFYRVKCPKTASEGFSLAKRSVFVADDSDWYQNIGKKISNPYICVFLLWRKY